MISVGSFIVNIGRELVFVAYPTALLRCLRSRKNYTRMDQLLTRLRLRPTRCIVIARDGDRLTE
jgi:hypothetical protein